MSHRFEIVVDRLAGARPGAAPAYFFPFDSNMVRSDGSRVSLAAGDWLKIAVSNAIAVGVIIVTLWTKQAIVENEIEHLKRAIAKLEQKIEAM